MTTLIFPDLHQPSAECIEAIENLIDREAPDQTIFLGDYFDRFYDTPAITERTAQWLTTSIAQPNRIHLVGNHDASYLWPSPATACPGWEKEKQAAFDAVLGTELYVTAKFTFFVFVDGWLLTHAGLADVWVPREPEFDLAEWLTNESLQATAAFASAQPHWFASIGDLRGGNSPAGGILWCDWREKRYAVKQLFGHTPSRWVRRDDRSVCLDTNVRHGPENYAIITDGELKTYDLLLPKPPR